MTSSNPNKQRSGAELASLVNRRAMISAHLSKELRQQYKRRSMAVRKGDEVKVIRGEYFGKAGAVTEVDTKNYVILVNGITVKRTVGTEKQVALQPSNVVITGLNLDDSMRQKILLRKVKEVKVEKKQPVAPVPAPVNKVEANVESKSDDRREHTHNDHIRTRHDHSGHTHVSHGQSRNIYDRSLEKKAEREVHDEKRETGSAKPDTKVVKKDKGGE